MKIAFFILLFLLSNSYGELLQSPLKVPIIINKKATPVLHLSNVGKTVVLDLKGSDNISNILKIQIVEGHKNSFKKDYEILSEAEVLSEQVVLKLSKNLTTATVLIQVKKTVDLLDKLSIKVAGTEAAYKHRFGISLVDEQKVKGARIPGIVTTPKGTLLAVYDARYDNARDLQGHMDIGLVRSTDGGQTWSPMQKIIDMKTWGGLPEKYNGVSDACILVDKLTGKVFVAGLWMHGVKDKNGKWIGAKGWNHQWRKGGSMSGLNPKETSQFMMVESSDDGQSWTEPLNLTKALKKPEWMLFAPAPGRGITMKNGTLVMPTQGRLANGMPFSNFIYSQDRGKTWKVSEPAHTNTTECQIVELKNGSLMLNMRDNRKAAAKNIAEAGRSVYVTKDMGQSWVMHPTSRKALPEPVCCAGLWAHGKDNLLVFSNPPNLRTAGGRTKMTLKFSQDDGFTWPQRHFLMLDEKHSAYSCLTSVDENTIGILYEGSQAKMTFMKIDLKDANLD